MTTTVLLIGLGNPGASYEKNRHNVGFRIVDAIVCAARGSFKRMASIVETASFEIGDSRVILAKPQTFMNLSGKAARFLVDFYKIPTENVCVFHDDIDLEFSQIKIKKGGGNGGHNGLKSIDAAIGVNYWRVRIGVGRPLYKSMVSDYVLGNFDTDQEKIIDVIVVDMTKNISALIENIKSGQYGRKN
ncbi:MAG: aminoacyl-tRNA hydrolase [Holosporaceae bacterium]|jgi:PTH1 family peptidyl-tRNA hydrolase|nr:aminoacyl-tRNA hydrolase [Holosporaceae bacterium]